MANYTENFTSVDGDVTDASELETEFDAIAAAIATKMDSDGGVTMTGALNMGSNLITNVTDPTAAQGAATKNFVENAEVADHKTVATTTISTTEVRESAISVTVPTDWNGYYVEILATGYIAETTAATGNTTIILRVREDDGTAGTELANIQTVVGDTTPDNRKSMAVMGFLEAQSTTGSITFSLTSEASANSLNYSLVGCNWRVRARRTS